MSSSVFRVKKKIVSQRDRSLSNPPQLKWLSTALSGREKQSRRELLCESFHVWQHLVVSHHIANLRPWRQHVDVDDPLRREA